MRKEILFSRAPCIIRTTCFFDVNIDQLSTVWVIFLLVGDVKPH